MKLRKSILIILFLFSINLFIFPIHADMGPKPSVTITIEGIDENEVFFGAFLADEDEVIHAMYSESYTPEHEDYDIYLKFSEYTKTNNYNFHNSLWKLQGNSEFAWHYYAPSHFRILLYFPNTDTFLLSDEYSRYAFDTYYKMDINNKTYQGTILLKKNYDYTWEIISFIARVIATLLIEIGIARMCFKQEKKVYQLLILINVITQIGLNLFLNILVYYNSPITFMLWYILAEFIVVLFEGSVYQVVIPSLATNKIESKAISHYTFLSNLASFAIGVGLARWIPGLF